jgi:hypothetical protein
MMVHAPAAEPAAADEPVEPAAETAAEPAEPEPQTPAPDDPGAVLP